MTSMSHGINESLQRVFSENNLTIDPKSDHFVIENSQDQTVERIRHIVESIGFCPLIAPNKMNGNFLFTIVPYKIPNVFSKIQSDNALYFSTAEISRLLKKKLFFDEQEDKISKDAWSTVNLFRTFVSSALDSALSELISRNIKDQYPIVEIGSGIGYSLPESLSSRIIRFQPARNECLLLKKLISDPLYQTDIEGFYDCLVKSGKKVSLFFALDVFDTMSPDKRKTSFSQIAQLQNIGDRILIMLDTNPCLDVTIKHLEDLYPLYAPFPYYPLTTDCSKLSFVLVPLEHIQRKLSESELITIIDQESKSVMSGHSSVMQHKLHQLQKKLNLKVIKLEDFFVDQVKKELEQTGYQANVNYHASFSTGELPKEISGIKQDLIYKPVTDTASVRQWSVNDQNLINWLAEKNLKLPLHFTETFLNDLREKNQKIFGAEILVIEATKID